MNCLVVAMDSSHHGALVATVEVVDLMVLVVVELKGGMEALAQ